MTGSDILLLVVSIIGLSISFVFMILSLITHNKQEEEINHVYTNTKNKTKIVVNGKEISFDNNRLENEKEFNESMSELDRAMKDVEKAVAYTNKQLNKNCYEPPKIYPPKTYTNEQLKYLKERDYYKAICDIIIFLFSNNSATIEGIYDKFKGKYKMVDIMNALEDIDKEVKAINKFKYDGIEYIHLNDVGLHLYEYIMRSKKDYD